MEWRNGVKKGFKVGLLLQTKRTEEINNREGYLLRRYLFVFICTESYNL